MMSNGQAWPPGDPFPPAPRLCCLLCGDTPSLHPHLPPSRPHLVTALSNTALAFPLTLFPIAQIASCFFRQSSSNLIFSPFLSGRPAYFTLRGRKPGGSRWRGCPYSLALLPDAGRGAAIQSPSKVISEKMSTGENEYSLIFSGTVTVSKAQMTQIMISNLSGKGFGKTADL